MIRGVLAAVLVIAAAMAPVAQAQDAKAGNVFFQQNCAVCHSSDRKQSQGQGPALFGVVGRKVGGIPGFGYSQALKSAGRDGAVWTAAKLDAFLADPNAAIPGTIMPVSVADARDRANLIAYLKTLKAPPGRWRRLNEFPDMLPEDVAAAEARAHKQGYEVWRESRPGAIHQITLSSMPKPLAGKSVANPAKTDVRPADAWPQAPAGFAVTLFNKDLQHPRSLITAPNGDIFVAETAAGRIKVLRQKPDGTADVAGTYATGLNGPFGMAFYPSGNDPQYLYVADALKVVRFAYRKGDVVASTAEVVVPDLVKTVGGHSTRTLVFTADGKHMLVSIGASTNVANSMPKTPPQPPADWEAAHGTGAAWGDEFERAAVLQFDPDGGHRTTFATGLRNCAGMAIAPVTGDLLCTNNERDYIGDDLPPDFFTRVPAGSFFGWPWYYIGAHEDPRHADERPDLKPRVRLPDLLIQPHSAPLGIVLYNPPKGALGAFGKDFTGDAFIALHGSGNRTSRTGTKVIRVKMKNGVPSDHYEDFLTGFIIDNSTVWGKPVGVTVAADGALLVSDDVSDTIWRVARKP